MRCYDCGEKYVKCEGDLQLENKFIGDYVVTLPEYHKCPICGELLFSADAIAIIESKEKGRLNELVSHLPVGEFISAIEAAKILGISRQAFHKNRRIKNGFIYSVTIDGKKLYNKKSTVLFKLTGDGRFPFTRSTTKKEIVYQYVWGYTDMVEYPVSEQGFFPPITYQNDYNKDPLYNQ